MKNSKIVKIVLILLIGVMMLSIATSVMAADSSYGDLAAMLNNTAGNNTTNNATENATTNETNNVVNSVVNNTTNNTLNTSALLNTTNNTVANNTVNNTSLPKTGIADSAPVVVLMVIFAISAVYAYKKVNDYKSL